MKKKRVKLTVDLQLSSDCYNHTAKQWDYVAIELISEYLNIRREDQFRNEEQFDMENGFLINDYHVNVVE